jgi:hypothetical protein
MSAAVCVRPCHTSPSLPQQQHVLLPKHCGVAPVVVLLFAHAGKARQLETASSSGAVLESDEALARRLHEELNALTRHSRRGPAAAGQPQQLQLSRSEKLPDSKAAAAGHTKPVSKQQRVQSDAEAQLGSMQQRDGSDKQQPGRKRSILNRELAMLVTDMVDSQLKPATGPRQTKSKDEQVADQHKGSSELLASVEQLLPILKHESSSSQSEQERLALEHVQAAVADGTPQAKQAQQRQQHFAARVSGSACKSWHACDSKFLGAHWQCKHTCGAVQSSPAC